MACGTAILASNNAMLRELIEPGVTGALYQGHANGLGEAISNLLKKPNQLSAWGIGARNRLKSSHRLSTSVAELESLLLT